MPEKFDAIVVGAGFAGLAVAAELQGNILLIDQKEVGAGQTSACCTLFDFPAGCEGSIQQNLTEVVLHTSRDEINYKMPCVFYTFDYEEFCKALFQKFRGKFIKTRVLGLQGKEIITNDGEYISDCIVDTSGWQAVLGSCIKRNLAKRNRLSFGIETEVKYSDDKLHFFLDPQIMDKGVAWLFPCGDKARLGIGSYVGETRLKEKLRIFLERFDLEIENLHGGYFSHELRGPTAGNVFLAGDAAGQCLPLTGEGIRPAIYFGGKCGRLAQAVIEKKKSLEEALGEYREFVKKSKTYYGLLLDFQRLLVASPNFFAGWIAKTIRRGKILSYLMRHYEKIACLKEV